VWPTWHFGGILISSANRKKDLTPADLQSHC
jgi:hypothetical protein